MLKLIVTSRDLPDIRETLCDVSYAIGLTTGEDVLEESKADVQRYFTFASLTESFPLAEVRTLHVKAKHPLDVPF